MWSFVRDSVPLLLSLLLAPFVYAFFVISYVFHLLLLLWVAILRRAVRPDEPVAPLDAVWLGDSRANPCVITVLATLGGIISHETGTRFFTDNWVRREPRLRAILVRRFGSLCWRFISPEAAIRSALSFGDFEETAGPNADLSDRTAVLESCLSRMASCGIPTINSGAPLWRVVLLHDRREDVTHVVIRIHHSLSDGVGLVSRIFLDLVDPPDMPHTHHHTLADTADQQRTRAPSDASLHNIHTSGPASRGSPHSAGSVPGSRGTGSPSGSPQEAAGNGSVTRCRGVTVASDNPQDPHTDSCLQVDFRNPPEDALRRSRAEFIRLALKPPFSPLQLLGLRAAAMLLSPWIVAEKLFWSLPRAWEPPAGKGNLKARQHQGRKLPPWPLPRGEKVVCLPVSIPLDGLKKTAALATLRLRRDHAYTKLRGANCRVTVNDLLCFGLAGAYRRYLLTSFAPLPGQRTPEWPSCFGIHIPVSMRTAVPTHLNNSMAPVMVRLPADFSAADPVTKLKAVHSRLCELKSNPTVLGSAAVLEVFTQVLPAQVTKPCLDVLSNRAALLYTNVPGPPLLGRMAGHPVEAVAYFAPQRAAVGIGVSVFSYHGAIKVMAVADTNCLTQPRRLVEGVAEEIEQLTHFLQVEQTASAH